MRSFTAIEPSSDLCLNEGVFAPAVVPVPAPAHFSDDEDEDPPVLEFKNCDDVLESIGDKFNAITALQNRVSEKETIRERDKERVKI
jgi:hypothetical protein